MFNVYVENRYRCHASIRLSIQSIAGQSYDACLILQASKFRYRYFSKSSPWARKVEKCKSDFTLHILKWGNYWTVKKHRS